MASTNPSPSTIAVANPQERTVADRRRKPTGPWDALRYGRRVRQRRADEHRQAYYVDRFSRRSAVGVLILVACSLADAVATLVLIDSGGEEINPLMRVLLDYGVGAFLAGKLALTAAGFPVILICQHHYLFGTPVRVSHVLPILIGIYGILGIYQISLILSI